jgi:hypothetical protein
MKCMLYIHDWGYSWRFPLWALRHRRLVQYLLCSHENVYIVCEWTWQTRDQIASHSCCSTYRPHSFASLQYTRRVLGENMTALFSQLWPPRLILRCSFPKYYCCSSLKSHPSGCLYLPSSHLNLHQLSPVGSRQNVFTIDSVSHTLYFIFYFLYLKYQRQVMKLWSF